jgi:hypothetical protein
MIWISEAADLSRFFSMLIAGVTDDCKLPLRQIRAVHHLLQRTTKATAEGGCATSLKS